MRPDKKIKYSSGELWIGTSSWNSNVRSIKYAYLGGDYRISRGSPEIRIDDLVEMLLFALKEKELSTIHRQRILEMLDDQ